MEFHLMTRLIEFSHIDPIQFELAFIYWVKSLKNPDISKEVIAIDGKQVKGSKDSFNNIKATHIVRAWANNNQLVLGQVKVDDKSNEITAIPVLLDLLDIEGCIITIDVMGTQREIPAEKSRLSFSSKRKSRNTKR
jgi:hypothetical protein